MSGHSKWANIRVRKGAQDAKRGKIYTRHAKLIEIAVREGGGTGDPLTNNRLKTAIDNAKMDNVPNANIERAIKKGTGELKGEQIQEIVYEAYGPGGAALIIECLTDNRNRSLNNVRSIVEKRGGRFAESGSVLWMFDRKGVVVAERTVPMNDDLELALIDAGADDIDGHDSIVSVTSSATTWPKIRAVLQENGYTIEQAGLKYVAKQKVDVSDPGAQEKLIEFVDAIEEDEDVSEVHTNAD